MRAALIAAMLALLPAAPAQAAEAPIMDGVWKGTIGTLPVRACLVDAGDSYQHGSYYYLSQLKPISLAKLDGDKGWQEGTEGKARWTIAMAGKDRITGTWSTGGRSLPVALDRVPMGDDGELDGACSSRAYLAPRIAAPKVVPKPATAGKLAYTQLQYQVGKSFEDVDISSFQVPVQRPGDKSVNLALRKLLDPAGGKVDYLSCMAGNIGLTGMDGDFNFGAEPSFVSADWIDAEINEGGSCGGAHPYSGISHTVFDRVSGKEVQLAQWLAPKGMSATWDGGAKYWETKLLAPLRKLVLAAMPPIDDADCQQAVADSDYWDLALTPRGIAFTPSLPHVMQACADSAELSFARLAPFLSPAGKAAAARMKSPVLVP